MVPMLAAAVVGDPLLYNPFPMRYHEAAESCRAEQGVELASLTSQADFDMATKIIAEQQGYNKCNVGQGGGADNQLCRTWIGMKQKNGGFVNEDGTPATYFNWEPGQPGGDGDDCVAMGFGFNLGFTVVSCGVRLASFCRMPFPPPPSPAPPPPSPPPYPPGKAPSPLPSPPPSSPPTPPSPPPSPSPPPPPPKPLPPQLEYSAAKSRTYAGVSASVVATLAIAGTLRSFRA